MSTPLSIRSGAVLLILLAAGVAPPAATGAVALLRLDEIPGEAGIKGYEGWIELRAYGWGGRQTSDRALLGPLRLAKSLDAATPRLLHRLATGDVVDEGEMVFLKSGNGSEPATPFLKVELSDIFLTSIQFPPSPDHLEQFEIEFGEAVFSYPLATYETLVLSLNRVKNSASLELIVPEPVIAAIPDQEMTSGSSLAVHLWLDDPVVPLDELTVTAFAGDATLVPSGGLVLAGGGGQRSLSITPAAGETGTTGITVSVHNGFNSASTGFQLTVLAPAPPAAVHLDNDQLTLPGHPGDLVGRLVVDGGEPGATHSFDLADSAEDRFVLDDDRLVVGPNPDFDPAVADRHTVVIGVTDGFGHRIEGTLTVFLAQANQAPVLEYGGTDPVLTFAFDEVAVAGLSIHDPDAGEADLSVTLQVGYGTLETPPVAGVSVEPQAGQLTLLGPQAALRTVLAGLTYRPLPGFVGLDALLLYADDLGHSGQGGAQTTSLEIPIEVLLNRYTAWLREHFSSEDLANEAMEAELWGEWATPAGDGDPNLAKYAAGAGPFEPLGAIHRVQVLPADDPANGFHLRFSLRQRQDDPLLEFAAEVTSDPDGTWSGGPEAVEIESTSDLGNGFARVVYRDRTAAREEMPRFGRVRLFMRSPGPE